MSIYQNNNQQISQINSLIDNLETKLSQKRNKANQVLQTNQIAKTNNIDNRKYSNNNNYYGQKSSLLSSKDTYPSYNNYILNNKSNLQINQLTNYELRLIIKEEFDSLFRPYQKEINNNLSRIKEEINNIYELNNDNRFTDIKKDKYDIDIALKEIKKNLYDYVSFNEYNKKINELEGKINMKNNQNNDNYLKQEIYNIKEENEEIKNQYNDIKNKLKKIEMNELKQSDDNMQLNEIKLKDIMNKNSLFQKDFESLKEQINIFKDKLNTSIMDKNKILNELELKYNSINN